MSRAKAEKLFTFCQRFVREQEISCPEAVSQNDNVIEAAYEFIEGVCDIVGYHEFEEEE